MLRIQREQFERLQMGCQVNFLFRMQAVLTESHPALIEAVPVDNRGACLAEMWDRAKGYGLTTESNVYQFVAASLKYGLGFEQTPPFGAVRALLERPEVNQNLKMMQLNEAMRVQFEEPRNNTTSY